MSTWNRVEAIGNFGSNPEVKFMLNGSAVCNVSIATTSKWKDKEGGSHEHTEWLRLVFWRKQAELVGQYFKKGDPIHVRGELRTRSYDKDGTTVYRTEIEVKELNFLPKTKSHDEPEMADVSQGMDEEPPF